MHELTDRNTTRTANIPVLLFGLVAIYIVLQFVWWAWLLISKDQEIFGLQQQLLLEGVTPEIPVRLPQRTFWMVLGEGGVFLLLILLALWIIFRTVKHELTLARQQRDFLLAASHELRTPIAGLKLHFQTLQRADLDNAQREVLSGNARTEIDRLHALTEKILLATRLETTIVPLARQPVDVAAIFRSVHANGRATYGVDHELLIEVPATLMMATDANAFRSIAENLLENACKYSPPGSTVELELKAVAGRIELQVRDEGSGVPEAERALIFRKFHRGGCEETRGTKGTGLGLYIVHRLTTMLGGHIEHRHRAPRGSIFVATFPAT
ncbi:MAG: HAMP domain-containing histidine kinase [Flavobacteriales bacterium]|nr:HAMP domain-containing histidine kinase [Flavobacteriales bacterium]